jgi:hypothetical protein
MLVNVQHPAHTKVQENILPNLCTTVERKQKKRVDFREKRMTFLMPTYGHSRYVEIRTATATHNMCVMEDAPLSIPAVIPPPYHSTLHASAHAGVISSVAFGVMYLDENRRFPVLISTA